MFAPALLEAVREVEEEEEKQLEQTQPRLSSFSSLPSFSASLFTSSAPLRLPLPPAVPLSFSSAFFPQQPPPAVPLGVLPPPLPGASSLPSLPLPLARPAVPLSSARSPSPSPSPPSRKARVLKSHPSPVLSTGARRSRPSKHRSASKEREAEERIPPSPQSVTSVSSAPSSPLSGSVLLPFTVEEDEAFMAEQRREAGELLAGVRRGLEEEDEEDQRLCRYDAERFDSVGEFIDHLKYVHSMSLSQYNKAKDAAQAAKKPRQSQQKRIEQRKKNEHHCELCGKAFTSLSRLAEHYSAHEAAFQQEDKAKAKLKKAGPTTTQPVSPVVAPSKPRLHLVSRLPLPPPPTEAEDEDDTVCAVCLSGESTDENLIMFCDGPCRLAYHQDCIGADYVPEGDWFCSERCERREEMTNMARWVKDRREEYERRQRERIAAQQSGGPRETDPAVLMLKGFWEEVDGYFSMRGMVEARELLEEALLDESLMVAVERGRSYREQWADDDAREEEETRGAFGGSSRRRKSAAEAAAQRAKSMEHDDETDDEDEDEQQEEEEEVEEIEQDESAMTKDEIAEKRKKEKLKKALSYEHSSERVKRRKKKGRKEPAIRLSLYAQLSTKPAKAVVSTSSSISSASSSQIDMVVDTPVSSPILSPQSSPPPSELSSSPHPLMEEEPPSRTLSSPVPTTVRMDSASDASSSASFLQPLAARSKSDGAALSFDLRPSPLTPPTSHASATVAAPSPSQGGKQPRSAVSLSSPHPMSNKAPRSNGTGGKAPRTNTASLTEPVPLDIETAELDRSAQPSSSSSSLVAPSSSPRGKGPATPLGKHHHPMPASHQSTKAPHTSAPSLTTSNEDELRDPIAPLPAPFFSLRSLEGDYMRSVGFRVSAARLSEARESGAGYVFPPYVYDPHTQTMEGDYDEKDDEKEEKEEGAISEEERKTRRKRDRAGLSGLELDIVSLARHEPAASHGMAVEVPPSLESVSAPSSPRTPHSLTQRPSRARSGSVPSASSHHLSGMATRASAPVVPLSPLNAAGTPLLVPLGPTVSSSGRPIRLTTRALSSSAFRTAAASAAAAAAAAASPPAPLIELLAAADTDEVANELWLCQQSYLAQHGHNEHVKASLLQAVQSDVQHFLAIHRLPPTFTSPTSQPALLRVLWERRRTEREVLDYFAENWLSSKAWKEYMLQVEEAEERGDEAADDVDEAEEERRREHRKVRRADRIVSKVVSEMVASVGKAVKQGKDDLRLRHRQEKADRRARKKEQQIARRVKGCMDWMLGKIVAKEELRKRRERIRQMGEEDKRREIEKERERRKERRRRRKLKKREKRRAERERERQRLAKLMRKKEREKKRRRREKERQRRRAKEAEEDRQRRRRREKKRRRRKAESSTSESSVSSSSDDSSGESSSASERSVSSASDSERSEEEKPSSSSSPSSDDDKAEEQEVYCYCRQPMSEHVPMICCDVCGEWYHGKCVSLTAAEMDNIDSYVCAKCEQHDQRRTTYFTQKRDDSQAGEQHWYVPAIRVKRVGVMDVPLPQTAEGEGDAESEVKREGEDGEKKAESQVRVLYEVVRNDGVALAEEAEDELLSQPLSIHRAASLKLRLRKQQPEGRASRRLHLWRVARVVSKNVYWARESGLNWHYIRETAITSKDKRWIEAPGVVKVYAEDGQWLLSLSSDSSRNGVKTETDDELMQEAAVTARLSMEVNGEEATQPTQQRSHRKKAAPKKSHKRKIAFEPAEDSLQQQQQQQEEEQEPNNPPVESAGPPSASPPPAAPRVRRPARPRMSEAQRLMASYLQGPDAQSDEEEEADSTEQQQQQQMADEEAVEDAEKKDAADEDHTTGRRRSSRSRLASAAVVKEEKVAEQTDEEAQDEQEAVQQALATRTRRGTRSQLVTNSPASDSATRTPTRASSNPRQSAAPSPVSSARSSRRSVVRIPASAAERHGTTDLESSRGSRRSRDKRKQLDGAEYGHSDTAQQSMDAEDGSPPRSRNGLSSAGTGKSAADTVHSPSPSAGQPYKRQRRNGDLALIDSTTIFAQRSRRAAAMHGLATHDRTAHEADEDEGEEQQQHDEALDDGDNGMDAEHEQQQPQSVAMWEDDRRRSTRHKPGSSPQPVLPPPRPQRTGSAAHRGGRQATLLNYFSQ